MKRQYRHVRQSPSSLTVDIEGAILTMSNLPGEGGQLEALNRQLMFLRGLLVMITKELSLEAQDRLARYLGFELVN
jgi:hypothetical protein